MGLLRDRFVSMLQVDWPSQLSKYDQRRADINNSSWHQSSDRNDALPYNCSDPGTPSIPSHGGLRPTLLLIARVICLAKDCDVQSVLPVAYYELGTAYNPITLDSEYGVFDRPIARNVLTAKDWEVLMRGRDFIQHRLSKFIKDVLSAQPPIRSDGRFNCHHSVNKKLETWGCEHTARDWWFAHSYEALTDVSTFRDPLAFLKSLAEQIGKLELCPSCRVWMQKLMLLERQGIWGSLGEFYGIRGEEDPGCTVKTQA